MAKISIEIDTESKVINANMDGKAIPNVSCVCVDCYRFDREKELYVSITSDEVTESGLEYRTNYVSSAKVNKDKISRATACVQDGSILKVTDNKTLVNTISNILRKNNHSSKNGV